MVAGNWKMNGARAGNSALCGAVAKGAAKFGNVDIVVCPPLVYLQQAMESLVGAVACGAQDLSRYADSGAYTGEVSGRMLADLGVRYAIVGHSERRALLGDDNAVVADKFLRAQEAGLTPILCVGETLEQREANSTVDVVLGQLAAVIDTAGVEALGESVLAYEPVWAIGTGLTATPDQAQAVHAEIRGYVSAKDATIGSSLRVLYGGSVKPDNAAELFAQADIDGGLIGGASLDAEAFLAICAGAQGG